MDAETERDLWLQILRRTARYSENVLNELGEMPTSFIIFHEDGAIDSFAAEFESREQHEKVLSFIALVGTAVNARGIIIAGEAEVTSILQQKDEDDGEFRDRIIKGAPPGGGVHSLTVIVVYRDGAGVRKVLGQDSAIATMPDGKLVFGKPNVTEMGDTMFGGPVDLMPKDEPDLSAQFAAGAWLINNGPAEMEKWSIYSIDDAEAPE